MAEDAESRRRTRKRNGEYYATERVNHSLPCPKGQAAYEKKRGGQSNESESESSLVNVLAS